MIYKWVRSIIGFAVTLQIIKTLLPKNRLYKSVTVVLSFVFLFTASTAIANLKYDKINLDKVNLDYEYIDYVKSISNDRIMTKLKDFSQSEGISIKDCFIDYSDKGFAVKNITVIFDERLLIEDERNINKIELIIEKTSEYLNISKEVITVKYV